MIQNSKRIIAILIIVWIQLVIVSCEKRPLPYNLEIFNHSDHYSISDSLGYPIIEENYHINFDKSRLKVLKIHKYTFNELGFIVEALTNEGIRCVIMTPKKKQMYPELEVTYKVILVEEYRDLGIEDSWTKIR